MGLGEAILLAVLSSGMYATPCAEAQALIGANIGDSDRHDRAELLRGIRMLRDGGAMATCDSSAGAEKLIADAYHSLWLYCSPTPQEKSRFLGEERKALQRAAELEPRDTSSLMLLAGITDDFARR